VSIRITPARRNALVVLAGRGRGRESNKTDYPSGTIYWQTARSLHRADLIEQDSTVDPTCPCWVLTAAGRDLAAELGIGRMMAG
jgi:hypothetical protein